MASIAASGIFSELESSSLPLLKFMAANSTLAQSMKYKCPHARFSESAALLRSMCGVPPVRGTVQMRSFLLSV